MSVRTICATRRAWFCRCVACATAPNVRSELRRDVRSVRNPAMARTASTTIASAVAASRLRDSTLRAAACPFAICRRIDSSRPRPLIALPPDLIESVVLMRRRACPRVPLPASEPSSSASELQLLSASTGGLGEGSCRVCMTPLPMGHESAPGSSVSSMHTSFSAMIGGVEGREGGREEGREGDRDAGLPGTWIVSVVRALPLMWVVGPMDTCPRGAEDIDRTFLSADGAAPTGDSDASSAVSAAAPLRLRAPRDDVRCTCFPPSRISGGGDGCASEYVGRDPRALCRGSLGAAALPTISCCSDCTLPLRRRLSAAVSTRSLSRRNLTPLISIGVVETRSTLPSLSPTPAPAALPTRCENTCSGSPSGSYEGNHAETGTAPLFTASIDAPKRAMHPEEHVMMTPSSLTAM
eukprot:Opistho-1_new@60879